MKMLRLKYFLRNIYNAFVYDSHAVDLDSFRQIQALIRTMGNETQSLNQQIDRLQLQIILSYASGCASFAEQYASELNYLKQNGLCVFPYDQRKTLSNVEGNIDHKLSLPYVLHKDKRLYFPAQYSLDQAKECYRNYIETENILGGGFREKAPHQYQNESFKIEIGDVLFDIGCAEGLLSLDAIDIVSKVYLVESDPVWIPALKATFAPYFDKVEIIQKLVSDTDSNLSIRLDTILQKEEGNHCFVKMDIEGFEYPVLNASKDYLIGKNNFRFACCTYHTPNDAKYLSELFTKLGRSIQFSEGYMLFMYRKQDLIPPYFRSGIIRVQ